MPLIIQNLELTKILISLIVYKRLTVICMKEIKLKISLNEGLQIVKFLVEQIYFEKNIPVEICS